MIGPSKTQMDGEETHISSHKSSVLTNSEEPSNRASMAIVPCWTVYVSRQASVRGLTSQRTSINVVTSPTVVTVGGLARSDSGSFPHEFSALLDRLRSAGSGAADGAPVRESVDAVSAGKD